MEEGKAAPHGVLLAVVLGLVAVGSSIIKKGSFFESIPEIIGPGVLLILPIFLIVLIRVLSSERINCLADLLSSTSPDSIHRAGGSPVGVGLLLVLILLLLYFRFAPSHRCRVDCDDD
ncbi:unnamed protein product [Spirodela intermedia]|uniref:Uncharacterized protein n=1 Tax=Spirodela intermedia TaxID=51605 RepID=A0A7I8JXZ4_SPIIN|nr:unnamed protein product [Spirodela intermedia]